MKVETIWFFFLLKPLASIDDRFTIIVSCLIAFIKIFAAVEARLISIVKAAELEFVVGFLKVESRFLLQPGEIIEALIDSFIKALLIMLTVLALHHSFDIAALKVETIWFFEALQVEITHGFKATVIFIPEFFVTVLFPLFGKGLEKVIKAIIHILPE